MEHLYVLRYTLNGFDLCKCRILTDSEVSMTPVEGRDYTMIPRKGYTVYAMDNGQTNIIRDIKLNTVIQFGDFNFVAYFKDKSLYHRMKAEMCGRIEESLEIQERVVMASRQQYHDFLYAKLGEEL